MKAQCTIRLLKRKNSILTFFCIWGILCVTVLNSFSFFAMSKVVVNPIYGGKNEMCIIE